MRALLAILVMLTTLPCDGQVRRRVLGPKPNASPYPSSGLVLWLKADTETYNNNDLASIWHDRSGNGNDVTSTGTERPTFKTSIFNSLPAMYFSGNFAAPTWFSNLNFSGFASYTGLEMIVVHKSTASPNVAVLLSMLNTAGTVHNEMRWNGPAGNQAIAFIINEGNTLTGLKVANNYTNIFNALITASSGVCELYYNGILTNSVNLGGAITLTINQCGVAFRAGSDNITGYIPEILVYNRPLTSSERTSVTDALKTKYAIFNY